MHRLDDLFGNRACLSWLPGETLFSLVSRHHYFWGHTLSANTCQIFYNHTRAGSQHDFPSRLLHLVDRTQGFLGNVSEIARNRTLLGYYAAFASAHEVNNAIACMASDSVAHLKFRLGILTSRFRANHPLKACAACMEADHASFGWAYWHVDHQYPGMWVCQKHGELLQESTLKATGVGRFQWHLPDKKHFRELSLEKQCSPQDAHVYFQSLSRQVSEIVSQVPVGGINTARLHEVYLAELDRRSWVSVGGSLRMQEIVPNFLRHIEPLRVLPELDALPSTADEAVTQLPRLLRPPRSGTHPLRHLVLINWLFGSADVFWQNYSMVLNRDRALLTCELGVVGHPAPNIHDPRKDQLVALLSVQKQSFRAAAKNIGIDVGTAMAWAAQAGLSIPRRPKKLVNEIRLQTIADLQLGVDKAVVAQSAGVSVVTVTKLLLSEPGLHAAWKQAREMQAQASARDAWLHLLRTQGAIGLKLMRALDPAAYAWLYRNDHGWLDDHKPDRQTNKTASGSPRIRWDKRDDALSAEVNQAVLRLRMHIGADRIKLGQIVQAVPALKAKLSALDRLPLTRRAIDQALQHHGIGQHLPDLFG